MTRFVRIYIMVDTQFASVIDLQFHSSAHVGIDDRSGAFWLGQPLRCRPRFFRIVLLETEKSRTVLKKFKKRFLSQTGEKMLARRLKGVKAFLFRRRNFPGFFKQFYLTR